jgi:hypothetical protein
MEILKHVIKNRYINILHINLISILPVHLDQISRWINGVLRGYTPVL